MSIDARTAAAVVRRAFSRHSFAQKLHVAIRFLTCPFTRTLHVLPAGARLLDVGAGHGTFGYLALATGAGSVIAVEPDLRKIFPPSSDQMRWVTGFDDTVRGSFDVVSMFDVTYLLSVEHRVAIYQRAFDRLVPGGTLLLKELDPEKGVKAAWARFQEWLNSTFLHVTLGEGFVYQTTAELQKTLEAIGFCDFTAEGIDRWYPHAHVLYTARKPGGGQVES